MSDNDIFQGDTINTNINNKYCTSGLRLQVLYLFTKTRFTCHVPTHALSGLVVQTPVHLLKAGLISVPDDIHPNSALHPPNSSISPT